MQAKTKLSKTKDAAVVAGNPKKNKQKSKTKLSKGTKADMRLETKNATKTVTL